MAWMGFGRGGASPVRSGPAPVDFMEDERLTALLDHLVSGAMDPAELATVDLPTRDYLLGCVLHDESPMPGEVAYRWWTTHPTAESAAVVGMAMVRDAWRVRSRAAANDVSREAHERFASILSQTEQLLLGAAERWPDSVLPWIPLQATTRGLVPWLGRDAIRQRFEQAYQREPYNYLVATEVLQSLCPKWYGSYEATFSFARSLLQAPRDSPTRMLIAHAELELLFDTVPQGEAERIESRAQITPEWEVPAFVEAVGERPTPQQVQAMTAVIAVYRPATSGLARGLEKAIALTAGRCGGYPYRYYEDPLATFDKDVAQVLAEARRV